MADKIVKLVDKNSNNLYPVAGAVIDNAVSTGAISSQAVTNPKIENGAVNGVENNATAIGTAKLALDTVGTPNLRDASVTSDKIDWPTLGFQAKALSGVATGISVPGTFTETLFGDTATFDVEDGGQYIVATTHNWVLHNSTRQLSIGLKAVSGSNTQTSTIQVAPSNFNQGFTIINNITADGGTLTVQRTAYAYTNTTLTASSTKIIVFRVG